MASLSDMATLAENLAETRADGADVYVSLALFALGKVASDHRDGPTREAATHAYFELFNLTRRRDA